jgi:hypothetical protein
LSGGDSIAGSSSYERGIQPGRISFVATAAPFEPLPPGIVDKPKRTPEWCQSQIGVVDPKQQTMLGSRREHPVWLEATSRDEIIDENPDVTLITPDDKGLAMLNRTRGVYAGDQTLSGGLLVSDVPLI